MMLVSSSPHSYHGTNLVGGVLCEQLFTTGCHSSLVAYEERQYSIMGPIGLTFGLFQVCSFCQIVRGGAMFLLHPLPPTLSHRHGNSKVLKVQIQKTLPVVSIRVQ